MPDIVKSIGLSIDQLKTLGSHPLVTIGGHTESHPELSRLEQAEALQRDCREQALPGECASEACRSLCVSVWCVRPTGSRPCSGCRLQDRRYDPRMAACLNDTCKARIFFHGSGVVRTSPWPRAPESRWTYRGAAAPVNAICSSSIARNSALHTNYMESRPSSQGFNAPDGTAPTGSRA